MVTAEQTTASERARVLVQGAYDLHVHVGPDVPPRRIDDVTLARRFAELGLAGFALKSHYTSTAERAQVVTGVVEGVEVIGTLSLNQAVGGMNPLAVEIAAREGARIVWMPTVDSPAETAGRTKPKPGDKVPQWASLQHELRELGLGIEAVEVTGDDGELLPETRQVLRAIARHGLILATAHLARDDTFAVVDGALEEGVEHIVVTHPEFTCQNFSIEDQVALAERGCLLERCLSTPFSGKTTWEHVVEGVRAVGVERSLFSSDLGNPDYPAVEDGLALWADRLLGSGFDEDEVRELIVGQSRRLVRANERSSWSSGRTRRTSSGERAARSRSRPQRAARRACSRSRTASAASPASSGRKRARRSSTSRRCGTRRRSGPRPRSARASSASTSATTRSRSTGEALGLLADKIREFAPDVLITHTDRDPFNPDHAAAFFAVERARALAAGAGVASAFETVTPPEFLLFEPHQPEICNFTPTTFVDITPVIEQKNAAMAEMKAQSYLQTYYGQRAEQRGNHARRSSGKSEVVYAEAFQRVIPQTVSAL